MSVTTQLQSAKVVPQPLLPSLPVTTSDIGDNVVFVADSDVATAAAVTTGDTSTATVSDNSNNTETVSSDVAPVDASITAGTPNVADDNDNTASVGSDVAPVAASMTAGTPTVSDDSNNTMSFGSDDAREFSHPTSVMTATTLALFVLLLLKILGLEGYLGSDVIAQLFPSQLPLSLSLMPATLEAMVFWSLCAVRPI